MHAGRYVKIERENCFETCYLQQLIFADVELRIYFIGNITFCSDIEKKVFFFDAIFMIRSFFVFFMNRNWFSI